MQDSKAENRATTDRVLEAMAGQYAIAPAARNMLLVLAAVIVPLLVLILARLLEKLMPSLAALVSALLLGLALLAAAAESAFGALRIGPAGIERHSPWFWRSWRIGREEMTDLRAEQTAKGRYLVIATRQGLERRLPFRPGFAAGAALLEGDRTGPPAG